MRCRTTRPSHLVLAALLAACGSDPTTTEQRQTEVLIGPEGGALHAADQSFHLTVPPGALQQPVALQIRRLADDQLPPGGIPGTAVEIGPAGVSFALPVQLTLAYDPQVLPADGWLRAVRVGDGAKLEATQLVTHNEEEAWVTAQLVQSGTYALAELKTADAVKQSIKTPITKVDVLIVVDNSNSMAQEQENLRQNFPKMIDALEQADLDYRVGVISTDLGAGAYQLVSCEQGSDEGRLQHEARLAGCTPPADPWIDRVPGDPKAAGEAFACIAGLGTGGCGFEQPLEAIFQALEPATNPGFLRPDAALALVVITDEDDCSAAQASLFDPTQDAITDPLGPLSSFRCFDFGVTCDLDDRNVEGPRQNCQPAPDGLLHGLQRYVGRLEQLKPNGEVIVSVVAGDPDKVNVVTQDGRPALAPSCESSLGHAIPPVRLAAFAETFGPRGSLHSICAGDLSPALAAIGQQVVESTLLSWCLPYAAADTNPLTAEIEGDCLVAGSQSGPLPACAATAGGGPCYRLATSAACGPANPLIEVIGVEPADLGDDLYAICLSW